MSRKIEDFGQELVDVVLAIKRGKKDGHIGLVDLWRIIREIKDVVALLPNFKDFPDELADMSFEQIETFVAQMYLEVQTSDAPNLSYTIDQKDVVLSLQGVKCFAEIGD